jgi:hypothetical protein
MLLANSKYIFWGLIFCLILSNCKKKELKPIKFEYLKAPFQFDDYVSEKVDSHYIKENGKRIFVPSYIHTSFGRSYIVENYVDDEINNRKIDSFACIVADSFYQSYTSFHIAFYRKTKITNNENIKLIPQDINDYSYSNDLIIEHSWSQNNKRCFRQTFHNFKNKKGFDYCEGSEVQ